MSSTRAKQHEATRREVRNFLAQLCIPVMSTAGSCKVASTGWS